MKEYQLFLMAVFIPSFLYYTEEDFSEEGTQNDKYSLSQTFCLIVFKVPAEDNEVQWSIYELILKKNKISYRTRTDLQPD